jgi:hypothetical protein
VYTARVQGRQSPPKPATDKRVLELFGDEKQKLGRHVRELMYQDGDDEQQIAGNSISSKPMLSAIFLSTQSLTYIIISRADI